MNSTSPIEQRTEVRSSVQERVRIFYGPDLSRWWDCNRRDASPSGMKLEAPSSLPLPDWLTILDIATAEICIVQIRWRRGDMIGCRIKSRHDLHETRHPPFEVIRTAWKTLN